MNVSLVKEGQIGYFEPRIGSDESGKGDYFGPLVVAACYADADIAEKLLALGVRDSKRLSDGSAIAIAERLKSFAPHAIVAIGPERYNDLHDQMRNLNRLLAWGHARAIENLLEEVTCDRIVTDQFGDERFVARAMMERGKQVRLEQRPRAEDDLAVAAASILARAEFLRWLERLSVEVGIPLPKGAGPLVDETARQLIKRDGIGLLRRVAKVHFKTTQKALTE